MTRRMRRPAAVLAASVVAVGGFAAAGAPAAPVTIGVLAASTSLTVGRPSSSHAGLFLLLAGACGLLLLVGSMLPSPAIRPSLVHNVVVVHRIDLALVGGAIVVLVGILR